MASVEFEGNGQECDESVAAGLAASGVLSGEDAGERQSGRRYFAVIMRRKDWQETIQAIEALVSPADVICPLERVQVRGKRRRSREPIEIIQPRFLGYVLVELLEDMQWNQVLDLDGIVGVLKSGGNLLTVGESHLKGFKKGVFDGDNNWDGSEVEFKGGPFDGLRGKYSNGKVLVDFMGTQAAVETNLFTLIKRSKSEDS